MLYKRYFVSQGRHRVSRYQLSNFFHAFTSTFDSNLSVCSFGSAVKKASAVDGEWENVELEEDATSVEADTVKVAVPADEKAAFYKFVVPNKQ
jgi:hypothetical protein